MNNTLTFALLGGLRDDQHSWILRGMVHPMRRTPRQTESHVAPAPFKHAPISSSLVLPAGFPCQSGHHRD